MKPALFIPIALSFAISACAAPEGEFPSLTKRPFESGQQVSAPIASEQGVALALPSSMARKINALIARHRAAQKQFDTDLPDTQRVVNGAAGSPSGGESWANAQVILSRLDRTRADSVVVQGEIDDLLSQQLDEESKGKTEIISALMLPIQNEIVADVAKQNAEISRLVEIIGQ